MSFRPEEPRRFGPPLRECVPSYVYLGVSLLFVVFVAYGHVAPEGTLAYHYVIEAAHERALRSETFASLVLLSGVASVLRSHMRGVRVLPDGIETTEVLLLGLPRIRRLDWPMIDRFRFSSVRSVGVDLWNGTREFLPDVGDREAMISALRYIAEARAIPYVGDLGGAGDAGDAGDAGSSQRDQG
jgi:hypothetical protein